MTEKVEKKGERAYQKPEIKKVDMAVEKPAQILHVYHCEPY